MGIFVGRSGQVARRTKRGMGRGDGEVNVVVGLMGLAMSVGLVVAGCWGVSRVLVNGEGSTVVERLQDSWFQAADGAASDVATEEVEKKLDQLVAKRRAELARAEADRNQPVDEPADRRGDQVYAAAW